MRYLAREVISSVIIQTYYRFPSTSIIAVIILTLTSFHIAQVNASESDFFDDSPLILTVSRMSKPLLESPASVSVITRQMIESSGAIKLADIFRMVPGFLVGNYNGNTPVVTYQGLGEVFERKLQVLIDGRSVFIPSFGGVPWNNLPLLLEDIERVEVIRGPNAVTYGANAFLATINIITRHAAEDLGIHYSASSSGGSDPELASVYLKVGGQQENLDWRLSVGHLEDEGYPLTNDSLSTNKFNLRADYLASQNQFWTILAGSSQSTSGRGTTDNPTNIERDEEASNSYINIRWEHNTLDAISSIRLAHTEQKVTDAFQAFPPGFDLYIDFGRVSRRTDLELSRSQELNTDLRLVYGGSIRQDEVKSLFLFNNLDYNQVDTTRLFTAIEWRLDQNWLFDLGTTLEDSSLTELENSPRLSIIRKLNADNAVRFVASQARRNPILYEHSGSTIYEVTSPPIDVENWRGNPNIEPENILSYEFGLRSQLQDSRVSSDIKLFTYEITSAIDIVNSGDLNILGEDIETAENRHDVRVNGLEVSLDFSPLPNLDINSGFSFINAESDNQHLEDSFPESSIFLTGLYQWQSKHSLSASLYTVSEMKWLDGEDIPALEKLDIRYAYTLDEATETRLELIGQNILEEYSDYFVQNINEAVYLIRLSGGF